MVVGTWFGDTKPDNDLIQESRFCHGCAGGSEIVTGRKDQFVDSNGKCVVGKDRSIHPAISIGHDGSQFLARFARNTKKLDPDTFGRTAPRGIQYVCCQPSHKDTCPLIVVILPKYGT